MGGGRLGIGGVFLIEGVDSPEVEWMYWTVAIYIFMFGGREHHFISRTLGYYRKAGLNY